MLPVANNSNRMRGAVVSAAALCVAAVLVAASGCTAPRTFPSPSGDQGLSADSPPLPQVVCTALQHAHKTIAPNTPLVYNLPAEMNSPAWGTYERNLAPGKPMCPGDKRVWTVRQARIDGGRAQVDIECPTRDGFYQLITVHMNNLAAGVDYQAEYLQYWKVPVKDPVCNTPAAIVEKYCSGAAAAPATGAKPAAGSAPVKTEDPSK